MIHTLVSEHLPSKTFLLINPSNQTCFGRIQQILDLNQELKHFLRIVVFRCFITFLENVLETKKLTRTFLLQMFIYLLLNCRKSMFWKKKEKHFHESKVFSNIKKNQTVLKTNKGHKVRENCRKRHTIRIHLQLK